MTGGVGGAIESVHEIGPLVASRAAEAEHLGHLTDDVIDGFHSTGLVRMLLPADLGGLDLTLPESVEVVRQLSTYDASAGWVLTIMGDGPLFGRCLAREGFEELFAQPRDALVGSLNPMGGRAEPVPGGYRFTGTAGYASGSHHATWLMAGAWVHRDGQPAFDDQGPELLAGIMPIGEATILDTWDVAGMRATGSNDCTFADVFIPQERTFRWPEPEPRFETGAFGAIPLMMQLGTTLVATVVGAARGAQAWFLQLATEKTPTGSFSPLRDRAYAQMAVGEAEGLILAAEDAIATAIREVWAQGERREPFDDAARVAARVRIVTAVRLATRAVDLLHDAAGMSAVLAGSPLERAWRDVHTGSQHVVFSVARLEVVGRVLLGLDPGSPII